MRLVRADPGTGHRPSPQINSKKAFICHICHRCFFLYYHKITIRPLKPPLEVYFGQDVIYGLFCVQKIPFFFFRWAIRSLSGRATCIQSFLQQQEIWGIALSNLFVQVVLKMTDGLSRSIWAVCQLMMLWYGHIGEKDVALCWCLETWLGIWLIVDPILSTLSLPIQVWERNKWILLVARYC